MNGSKTNIHIVKNIFKSLSPKDLKITIENCNILITEAIEKLSNLFRKPREFTTSGYTESNAMVNSIAGLRENNSVNLLIKEISELDTILLNEQHYSTFDSSQQENCNDIINQAIEIKEKFKNDYSEIIKEIQYHDITKQKLEHVLEINNDILKELKILESINNQENKGDLKYLEALKEIINIEIAQLIFSSELCNTAIKKIVEAFTEQNKIIDKTKSLSTQLKERITNILNLIHTDENAANFVKTNKETFKTINQLEPEKHTQKLSLVLPDKDKFENTKKTYTDNIVEIDKLSSSKGNFHEIIQTIINEISSIRKIISKDDDITDQIKENNLDFLKKKYTMNSERKIHELALENELLKDFFTEMTESTDDNDVEFF